jgi:hypothetical protein
MLTGGFDQQAGAETKVAALMDITPVTFRQ